MQIQINTGHSLDGREPFFAHIRKVVEQALSHQSDHITRVEVHLTDEHASQSGPQDTMRCAMEARLERHQPIAVTHDAANAHQAIDGAAEKLSRLVEHTFGKLRDERKRRSDPSSEASKATTNS